MNPQQCYHPQISSLNNLKQKRFSRQKVHRKQRSSPSCSEKQISNFYIKASSLQHSQNSLDKLFDKIPLKQSEQLSLNLDEKSATIRGIDRLKKINLQNKQQHSARKKPFFFSNNDNTTEKKVKNDLKNNERNKTQQRQIISYNEHTRIHTVLSDHLQQNVQSNLMSKLLEATMKLQTIEEENRKLLSELKKYKIKLFQLEQNYTHLRQKKQKSNLQNHKKSEFVVNLQATNNYTKRISTLEQQLQKIKKSSNTRIQILQQQLSNKHKQLIINKQKVQKMNIELDFTKRKNITFENQNKAMKKQYADLKKRFTQVLQQYTEIMKKMGKDQISKKVQNAKMKSAVFRLNDNIGEEVLEKLSISSGD